MSIAVFTITSEGQVIDPTIDVLGITVRRDLNRVSEARLVLLDGDVASGKFVVSDGGLFKLGAQVSISLRWESEGSDVEVFKGLVVRQTASASADGTRLVVEMKDRSVVLTRGRHSQVFTDTKDSDAISSLLSAAGLSVSVQSTTIVHPELVQYHATDWDFILSRADVMGLVVDAHAGKVTVAPMAPSGEPRRTLTLGVDIIDLSLELDGVSQWAEVAAEGWSLADQAVIGPAKASNPSVQVGDLKAAGIAESLGGQRCLLLHPVPAEHAELTAWADARLLRSRLALLRGSITVVGDAGLVPRDLVRLENIGGHFNGEALVSGVTHQLEGGTWTTELRLGLDADWFARRPDIAEAPAGGLLPPMQAGLQIGVVTALADDPAGELRVQLQLPALIAESKTLWARMARPDAGKDRGYVFWPEIGDEVVVGFFDGDPRHPVILGALHGSRNALPGFTGKPTDENHKRALVSRSGCVLGFDDEKKQITLQTPAGQKLLLDDDGKSAVLADEHGNTITLDKNGIVLKSSKDFTIDAGSGKVVIKGSQVDVQ
jgi:Rhs element Vgr protein